MGTQLLSIRKTNNMVKAIIFSAIVAAAVAIPVPDGPPAPYAPPPPAYKPAPYKPAPHGYKPEKLPPQPFAYQYGVKDDYSGASFDKSETQDDYGNVAGEYRVQLPDGRTQIVSYTADHENGYQAEVRYEGEARPEVVEPNDYLGPEGQVRVRQYPKHTKQPYGRY